MNGGSLKTMSAGWDNPVFLLGLRHRLRSGDYLFLCGVPVAYAVAWAVVGSHACLVPEPLPWPAGKLLFVVALALYFISLVFQIASRHDPLSTAYQSGALAQLLATGVSPFTWLTGAVRTFVVDLAVVLAFHLPIFVHVGLVGDVGLGAILLGVLVVSAAALSLCLLGLAIARRPFAGLLVGAALLGAYLFSGFVLVAPEAGDDADHTLGLTRVAALAPLAPVLPVTALAAVPVRAGNPVKGGAPVRVSVPAPS